jgi:hypothetical protein
MTVQPRLHGILRRGYDLMGRFLAKKLQNPYLADCAYLLLKPAEWLARWLLRLIVPEIDSIARKMYTG